MALRFKKGDILAYELIGLMTKVTVLNASSIPPSPSGFPHEVIEPNEDRYQIRVEEGRSKGQILTINPNIEDGPRMLLFSEWTAMVNRRRIEAPHQPATPSREIKKDFKYYAEQYERERKERK